MSHHTTVLPALPLVSSPLVSLPGTAATLGLEALFVKRDDQLLPEFSGCKARNLAAQLRSAIAAGAGTILMAARAGSNAVAAASLYAGRLGLQVCAILKPQVYSETAAFNLQLIVAAGAEIIPVPPGTSLHSRSETVTREMERLRQAGRRPYFIGFGGGDMDAAVAHAAGVKEAWQQLAAMRCGHIDRVYVAGASFSVAAGIAAGIALAGLKTRLVIVGVAHEEPPGQDFFQKAAKAALLAMHAGTGKKAADLVIDPPDFYCAFQKAFGEITPPLPIEARPEVANLSLDPVYTRKAFAYMVADAAQKQGGRFLFWHTGNSQPWPAGLVRPVLGPGLAALLVTI